jgi:hypothetical protein
MTSTSEAQIQPPPIPNIDLTKPISMILPDAMIINAPPRS